MAFRISLVNKLLICSWTGAIFIATACAATPVAAQIQPQTTCISSTPGVNPYASSPQSGAIMLYQNYASGIINYQAARQAALAQLGENLAHWSDHTDIANNDQNMVRIVVTYLDPVLVQYIVLNYVLMNSNPDSNRFTTMLTDTLNKLKDRNETLFIVTVTTQVYIPQAYNGNVLTVRFPVWDMVLINADGLKVKPVHLDSILNENIDITHEPVSGMVGYPLAIMHQGQCTWVMDSWTNNLTLHLESVILDNIDKGAWFWNIHYQSLVASDNNQPTPTIDMSYDPTRFSKIVEPPTPSWNPNLQFDNTDWRMYWEEMGRYLWGLIVPESPQ